MNSHVRTLKVAEFLLQIQAIQLNPENPFTWASGLRSPIYCDNRKTLSFPDARRFIRDAFVAAIQESYPNPDIIAGVATGGIAIGALVAEAMQLPFIYVRSEPKKHGLGNQVEGVLEAGKKVVVIEDLISTGSSSLNAVQALRGQKAEVVGLVAIFTYGFDTAKKNFQNAQCPWQTLSNYDALLTQAVQGKYISSTQHDALTTWKLSPEQWSELFTSAIK